MKILVPTENDEENRVALIPSVVSKIIKDGFEVLVESGAGKRSFFSDKQYEEAGAKIVDQSAWSDADIVVKVGSLSERSSGHEADMIKKGSIVIGFINPLGDPQMTERLAKNGITAFSMEMVPRISRAQSMDALSSQASVAGYKAVLLAANKLGQFFPMLTTAAGTITPAKLLVIGVGVAGLQCIATARRLGAVVEAFDIRPSSKQEVESLGAKFVDMDLEESTEDKGGYAKEVSEEAKKREREILAQHVRDSDVVITAAQVPGRKAPLLITKEMMSGMKEGSVIVDIAAEQGGNCEVSKPGEDVVSDGVIVMGPVNLPGMMPVHASQMYSKNIHSILKLLVKDGKINIDFSDEIVDGACVAHDLQVRSK